MTDERWGLMVAFPDQSASFVHGFEAGQLWAAMEAGTADLERTVHAENCEVIKRMARRMGYEVAAWNSTAVPGWVNVALRKVRPASHLRAV